jgi:hypothetical protein
MKELVPILANGQSLINPAKTDYKGKG